MKKIFLFLIISIFLVNLAYAETNPCGSDNSFLGHFKQGDKISLTQTCDTCTYVNLSKVNYPDSTSVYYEDVMTKKGVDYNYTITDTYKSGCYYYTVHGDKGGSVVAEVISFKITPSGEGGSENIVFAILIIFLVYGIALFGFFGRNEVITLIGGIAMLLLGGIYLITQGIIIYRDWFTNALAYLTLALGVYFTFMASYALYGDM